MITFCKDIVSGLYKVNKYFSPYWRFQARFVPINILLPFYHYFR